MVHLTLQCCLRKYSKNFVDKLRVYVRGGTGGNGLPSLGGIGGRGGDVYLVAARNIKLNLKDFKQSHPTKRFIADPGTNSERRTLIGLKGASIFVQVPHGITVLDAENNKVLGEISKPSDKILVSSGGKGGSKWNDFIPRKGQSKLVILDLKLIADVGFVGFPNAGKSSLLQTLSRAKPQIAEYAFTTIKPELGTMVFDDHRKIKAADLPGLIEGAHLNKGRGHVFLKHIERTHLLLFIVDVTGFQLSEKFKYRDAFTSVQLLMKELEMYDESLCKKPAILAVNKMDEENSNSLFKELKIKLKNWKEHVEELPENSIPKTQIIFKDIIPISALKRIGTSHLKDRIREEIDGMRISKEEHLAVDHKRKEIGKLSNFPEDESETMTLIT